MIRHCSALIGVVCFLGLQGLAFAGGSVIMSVQNGPWSDPDTWDAGVPNLTPDNNQVRISHVVGVTMAGQDADTVFVGYSAGAGTLNISSGDLSMIVMVVGTSGNTGTVNLSGGTFTPGNFLRIGRSGPGIFNMTGGSLVADGVDIPKDDILGSSGSFVLSGGALSLSGLMTIGNIAQSQPGTLTIAGDAFSASFRGTNNGQDGTVHFTSESTLVIRPVGPTSNDLTRFDVGSVIIDTGATLQLDPQYTPQVGDFWFIFISRTVVGGNAMIFTNVVTPAGVTISQSVVGTRGVGGPEKLVVTVTAVPAPSVAWVDFANDSTEDGSEANPWNTLAEGLANVGAGQTLKIKGDTATSATAETPTINQDVTLQAVNGTVTIGSVARDAERSGFVSRGKKR